MKFRHEIYQEKIQDFQKALSLLTEKQKTIRKEDLLLWEIGQTFEDSSLVSSVFWTSNTSIKVSIKDPISKYVFDSLLDNMDEIIDEYNFYFMPDASKYDPYCNEYDFYYTQNKENSRDVSEGIRISFTGNSCTYKKTGKLIPETKRVCTMIS